MYLVSILLADAKVSIFCEPAKFFRAAKMAKCHNVKCHFTISSFPPPMYSLSLVIFIL